jgi:hypothetical protein
MPVASKRHVDPMSIAEPSHLPDADSVSGCLEIWRRGVIPDAEVSHEEALRQFVTSA